MGIYHGHLITVKMIHSFNINFKANLALYQTLWHMYICIVFFFHLPKADNLLNAIVDLIHVICLLIMEKDLSPRKWKINNFQLFLNYYKD